MGTGVHSIFQLVFVTWASLYTFAQMCRCTHLLKCQIFYIEVKNAVQIVSVALSYFMVIPNVSHHLPQ